MDDKRISQLRRVITENLRIEKGGGKSIGYIDVFKAADVILARQNHVVFGRRGCGKTLLLNTAAQSAPEDQAVIYLNCEDFKKHSFPNVLIEILDSVFHEMGKHIPWMFGRRKRLKELLADITSILEEIRKKSDERTDKVLEKQSQQAGKQGSAKVAVADHLTFGGSLSSGTTTSQERSYEERQSKSQLLHDALPSIKRKLAEFFELSSKKKCVILHIDDFYHLARSDQPWVMDYIHRLCKGLPLFFKLGTLRHSSVLYLDSPEQPIGAQERHDYQPINVDYSFADFPKTEAQNLRIFVEYAKLAGLAEADLRELFKGDGFKRLVLAGGGVPRDCLSLFLEALNAVADRDDRRVGKDDVRALSLANFKRKIEELKADSEAADQASLLKSIYLIRDFCLNKQTNVFCISNEDLQKNEPLRELLFRLLDYRLIHAVGDAFSHKSAQGSYAAFMIDIGCYAHLRKLTGKMNEIDLSQKDCMESVRSSPIFDVSALTKLGATESQLDEKELAREQIAETT